MVLDGDISVDAFQVVDKHNLAPGINTKIVDSTRVLIPTKDGWGEIQVGDWIAVPASDEAMLAMSLEADQCLRLPYDQSRLSTVDP